ncbi:MAG: RNA-binding domain-containing protein [Chlamydiales bacterium]
MNLEELNRIVARGEDGTHQFKVDIRNSDSIASEMAALANSQGGKIIIGITDNGLVKGVSREDVNRINQLISNAASQHVRSPLSVKTENILLESQKIIVVVKVPSGIDKPYFDRHGVIWLKCGSDKRRINSKEELRRLFQLSCQFHADELPTKAGIEALDPLPFRDFLRNVYTQELPNSKSDLVRLLQNMNLATEEGRLNLAGLLIFAEQPEKYQPQFVIKAVSYPGTDIHAREYRDSEDFAGPLQKIFTNSLAFILRNLHKVQGTQGVNTPGIPEIPLIVFEELLVNALVHRDYMISAPIRLFVFDNRVEIISPGHLPNNLTVEKIQTGNSIIRNPILTSFVAKGLLPYRGLGSGIQRAIKEWPKISFKDDRDGCLFNCQIARIQREASLPHPDKGAFKGAFKGALDLTHTQQLILSEIQQNPNTSYDDLVIRVGKDRRTIGRNIEKLKDKGFLKRIGSKKSGAWEINIESLRKK